MPQTFSYLDPNDYDEAARIEELYQKFLDEGAPDGVVVIKGTYQKTEDHPILPMTVDFMSMVEDYIGGVKWDSDRSLSNPNVKPREFYLSWGEVDNEGDADYLHDLGVNYAMAYSQTAFYYPAHLQLRRLGEEAQDVMRSYLAAEIMHIYLGIFADMVGQNVNTPGATDEEIVRRLEIKMNEKFDGRFAYSVLGTQYINKVTTTTVDIRRLGIPLVNQLRVMA